MQLTRELWEAAQSQTLPVGTSYAVQRRRVDTGMTLVEQAVSFIAKNIGGVTYLRDHAGTGRASYTPVNAQRQRDAMQFLADTVFRDETFGFPAEFMSRLPLDNLDRAGDIGRAGEPPASVSFAERVLRMQRGVMDRMLSEKVAQRVLEAPALVKEPLNTLSLDEIYATLENTVWSDATFTRDVSPARRALQRDHAKRITAALTRPTITTAASEARALHRQSAKRLVAKLDTTLRAGRSNAATRAHLDEVRDSLSAALVAQINRAN